MKVLKATIVQKQTLEGTYLNGALLQFVQDINDNWVVNDSILNDINFSEIKDKLQLLELIDFEPKIDDLL